MAETVLDTIVAGKRREVAERLRGANLDAEPTRRSLAAALRQPGARFIMEVKQASPSGHRARHSVEQAAMAYAPVADAISVLIDAPHFGGRPEDIAAVRTHFAGPILAKDFIVDPAQVAEARRFGADAVLVMLSVLDDTGAAAVMNEARRLNMDAIVEVHDEAEMRRALALGAPIIGINNRDLKTLCVDLGVTRRLAPMIPDHVVAISESGIGGRRDVGSLAPLVDAFLVGSSLMAAERVTEEARALVHGRVKVCGLTNETDVERAASAGATHAGLVMVPDTPRAVDPDRAGGLARVCGAAGLAAVGVFRDAPVRAVADAAERMGLAAVQLHGTESEAEVAELRGAIDPKIEIWAASAVGDEDIVERRGADRTLYDTRRGGRFGGTGRSFDWDRVRSRTDFCNAVLAGGIGPDNAAAASLAGAHAIDVGSLVEAEPGRKDANKLCRLFAALRPSSRGDRRCA